MATATRPPPPDAAATAVGVLARRDAAESPPCRVFGCAFAFVSVSCRFWWEEKWRVFTGRGANKRPRAIASAGSCDDGAPSSSSIAGGGRDRRSHKCKIICASHAWCWRRRLSAIGRPGCQPPARSPVAGSAVCVVISSYSLGQRPPSAVMWAAARRRPAARAHGALALALLAPLTLLAPLAPLPLPPPPPPSLRVKHLTGACG